MKANLYLWILRGGAIFALCASHIGVITGNDKSGTGHPGFDDGYGQSGFEDGYGQLGLDDGSDCGSCQLGLNDDAYSLVDSGNWNITVDDRSINYFRSRLQIAAPNFIRFRVVFSCPDDYYPNCTSEAVHPFKWVWTYKSSRGLYPYLKWNVDYNLLSFGLLDVKTLWTDPYILFQVNGSCKDITMGTRETTEKIAEQLMVLVSKLSDDNETITEYQDSYFCFLAEAPGFRNSVWYHMALYLDYPISIINYNCCNTTYEYTKSLYNYSCMDTQMEKWEQCTSGPYILGIILFLYFPIILLKAAAWIAKNDFVKSGDLREPDENTPLLTSERTSVARSEEDNNWLYLDGNAPKSLVGLIASLFPDHHPVALSRLKRLVFVLLGPSIVFIQILAYSKVMPEMTREVVGRGVPVGFLSILGNTSDERRKAFVPLFGGPVVVLSSYYILGIIFLVIPKSVQDVIENGIPRISSKFSPLCLNARDIRQMSNIPVSDTPGYKNASNLFLCSFYMLFNGEFWKRVFKVQKKRLCDSFCFQLGICKCICILLLPLYTVFCLIEILICILYFALPLCAFIVVIVRGAVKTIAVTIRDSRVSLDRNIISILLKNRLVVALFSLIVAASFIFFIYTFCLVFIESFFFISQVIVFCYIAVIVYPAVAFGYLFFGIVLLYYIFRLIRGFGATYLDLLNDVVEICINIEEQDNYVSVFDGNLVIDNVKISLLRSIKINGVDVPVAQNVLQSFQNRKKERYELKFKNNTYGIRKELFDYVVRKHLPVHQQVLRVVFHLAMICLLLLITISLTAEFVTGPASEISDMMHVIFVVTVGALPRVLEVAMLDSSEHIHRDIKLRNLEDTISEYRRKMSSRNEPSTTHVQVHPELIHTTSNT